jgi:hypothetical protein
VSQESKLGVIRILTAENEERLDSFFRSLHKKPFWKTGMELVEYPILVDADGKVFASTIVPTYSTNL